MVDNNNNNVEQQSIDDAEPISIMDEQALPVDDNNVNQQLVDDAEPISIEDEQELLVDDSGLPIIDVTRKDLPARSSEAWQVIGQANQANSEPIIFKHASALVRLQLNEESGSLIIESLNKFSLRYELSRCAKCRKEDNRGNLIPEVFPEWLLMNLLSHPSPPVTYLRKIIYCPIFAADGTLHDQPGYNPDTGYYYKVDETLIIPEVPLNPTKEDVRRALRFISEPLRDIPFISKADKRNAIAVGIQPFVRELIDGDTPLYHFGAPQPRTGKTLSVDILTYPALGFTIHKMTIPKNDDEMGKKITSALRAGPMFILFDNVKYKLDSQNLSAVITCGGSWEDRLLGVHEQVRIPVYCTWLSTGNNNTFSTEIASRIVPILLDAKTDKPGKRTGFKHKDVRRWVKDHRGDLIWAYLVLIQNWIAKGKPKPEGITPIGGFEAWSSVIGGIFTAANVKHFLSNIDEFHEDADIEGKNLNLFIDAWYAKFKNNPVTTTELLDLILMEDLDVYLGKTNKVNGQKIYLGRHLATLRNRTVGNYRIKDTGKSHNKSLWKLVPVHLREVKKDHKAPEPGQSTPEPATPEPVQQSLLNSNAPQGQESNAPQDPNAQHEEMEEGYI